MTLHLVLIVAIFLLTIILMLTRPRNLHEAWAAALGGGLMLVFGLVTPRQAMHVTAQAADALWFLLALMLLSALLDRSGFFEWAALHAARAAKGDGRALFRNIFALAAAVTALLSLDTTALLLAPLALALTARLKISSRPFLFACAFVANTASLLLPVSNLTNLLFQSAFHLSFGAFTLHMAVPECAALWVNFLLFRRLFRQELPEQFEQGDLPKPVSVVPDQLYFRGALFVLGAVLVGYFAGALLRIPPYRIALVGCVLLGLWGILRRRVDGSLLKQLSWPLFPFVVGLLIVVRGVETLGLAHRLAAALHGVGPLAAAQTAVAALGCVVGANAINNLPMAILAIRTLHDAHAGAAAQYGALIGCDIGPNLTLAGSLATMLVVTSARQRGEDIGGWDFVRVGLRVTPWVLLAATIALWATYYLT